MQIHVMIVSPHAPVIHGGNVEMLATCHLDQRRNSFSEFPKVLDMSVN